ncbi:hypothetical protein [Chitinophaga pinensis]|uniref:Uncharacterized protein n=1 Tax=Chitinophaga pinensis (strain ATCC 43595 / DSM 2588 / LMG 13176 / NBRC 15968 / NCIMB 11800 / UQM 2034) TaxID=485918 RepID=A0A979G2S4_CHIPD|nr:hypothetical protein [Chitinophaga pinensis]ACU59739.1 hypothetical protein Cpin_2248 [Chitinophaga pinensis DSM 2588]
MGFFLKEHMKYSLPGSYPGYTRHNRSSKDGQIGSYRVVPLTFQGLYREDYQLNMCFAHGRDVDLIRMSPEDIAV